MKKIILGVSLTIAVLASGSAAFATELTVGQTQTAAIEACGTHEYTLIVADSRDYTLTLNQTINNMDLGVEVTGAGATQGEDQFYSCDTIGKDINESCSVSLEAGVEYKVTVDEWLCENDGGYDLLFQ